MACSNEAFPFIVLRKITDEKFFENSRRVFSVFPFVACQRMYKVERHNLRAVPLNLKVVVKSNMIRPPFISYLTCRFPDVLFFLHRDFDLSYGHKLKIHFNCHVRPVVLEFVRIITVVYSLAQRKILKNILFPFPDVFRQRQIVRLRHDEDVVNRALLFVLKILDEIHHIIAVFQPHKTFRNPAIFLMSSHRFFWTSNKITAAPANKIFVGRRNALKSQCKNRPLFSLRPLFLRRPP